uniref:Uncharacterized protein n=1 Tax=Tetradesmus obliquus TaxID=3088 RepID=A0A383VUH5_TETOB
MSNSSSCKSALTLLLAACLVMAAASRPLASSSSSSTATLLGSSSSTGIRALMQPIGTVAPMVSARHLLAKVKNQANDKLVSSLLKSAKVSSSSLSVDFHQ